MKTPLNDLLRAIRDGSYDSKLDDLPQTVLKACRARNSVRSIEIVKTLSLEQPVMVKRVANVRPKYLLGRYGKITGFVGDQVWVTFDRPVPRKAKTISRVLVDAYLITPVEAS